MPKVVHCAVPCVPALPECLDGHIQADLVAVFETIGDSLGRGVHANVHPLDLVLLDPGIECGLREVNDTQRWILETRPPGFFADGQPDLKRRLTCEFVKA